MDIASNDGIPASEQLKQASELMTGTEAEQREAVLVALRASRILLGERADIDAGWLLTLRRLEIALEDRDLGIADPILRPSDPPRNRPATASWIWSLRCCLAAALAFRMDMGESEASAWAVIQKDLSTDFTLQDVKSWKRQLEKGQAGHRDGQHYAWWEGFEQVRLQAISAPPYQHDQPKAKEQREQIYRGMFVEMAKRFLNR